MVANFQFNGFSSGAGEDDVACAKGEIVADALDEFIDRSGQISGVSLSNRFSIYFEAEGEVVDVRFKSIEGEEIANDSRVIEGTSDIPWQAVLAKVTQHIGGEDIEADGDFSVIAMCKATVNIFPQPVDFHHNLGMTANVSRKVGDEKRTIVAQQGSIRLQMNILRFINTNYFHLKKDFRIYTNKQSTRPAE